MSSIPVAVVSGDVEWRRALEAGLASRDFQPIALFEENEERQPFRARPLAILIDALTAPYGAVELAEQLTLILGSRCPALICLGETETPFDGELFAGRAARPGDAAGLLDELERLVPHAVGMGSGVVASRNAGEADDSGVKSTG